MAADPPSFASVQYWNDRFHNEPATFEWLQDPRALREVLEQSIKKSGVDHPRILHIGCGTSALPLLLRTMVVDPTTIHNTDFSSVAIDLGREREREVLANPADHFPDPVTDQRSMQWHTLDLLALDAVVGLLSAENESRYDLILDKSTCDAVACGEDFRTSLPYPLQVDVDSSPTTREEDGSPTQPPKERREVTHVHPVHVLALHLAYLSSPGARWIAVSYASHRFPFLTPYPAKAADGRLSRWMVERGFVHPGKLWELERKDELVTELADASSPHEPRISHTLYVLRRTAVKLRVATPIFSPSAD